MGVGEDISRLLTFFFFLFNIFYCLFFLGNGLLGSFPKNGHE